MHSRAALILFTCCLAIPLWPAFLIAQEKVAEKGKADPAPAAKVDSAKVDSAKVDSKKTEEKPADKKTDTKSDDKAAEKSAAKSEEAPKPKDEKKGAEVVSNAPSKVGPLLQEFLNGGEFPTPRHPEVALRARHPYDQPKIQEGYNLAKRLDLNVRVFRDRLLKGKVAELNVQEVAISHVANVKLGHIVEGLRVRQEPAGEDLSLMR